MIQAVVSDFGGVLTSPLLQAFNRVQDDIDVPIEAYGAAMAYSLSRDGEHPLYVLERGEITEAEFLERVGRGLEVVLGRHVELHGFGARLMDALEPNRELFDHYSALRRRRGLRFALLTNNVREWESAWRSMLPIDDLFELVVDSAFVGMRKPEPEIYALALERLGVEASSCAFVDDTEINVDAARTLGFHAVHFRDTAQAIASIDALLGS